MIVIKTQIISSKIKIKNSLKSNQSVLADRAPQIQMRAIGASFGPVGVAWVKLLGFEVTMRQYEYELFFFS